MMMIGADDDDVADAYDVAYDDRFDDGYDDDYYN